MKIYLVNPVFPDTFWGLRHVRDIGGYTFNMSNLALPTLAAMVPREFDVEICDENIEPIDFDTDADLVGVTGYNIQAADIFRIAERFRARGKPVVIGGPYASLCPELCEPHADVVMVGEAENIFPRFLADFAGGAWQERYEETGLVDLSESPVPRWDLVRFEKYGQILLQTTRGCPFNCEFCDVIVYLGRKVRAKTPEQIIAEIEAMVPHMYRTGHGAIFFADDNFIGNRVHAKKVCRALIDFNRTLRNPIRFYTQATITLANDEELLELMAEAGFGSVFIGIETPRKSSLEEVNKRQNITDLLSQIRKIQSAGIFVWAGMIVGFDNDDLAVFGEQLDFLNASNIPISMTGMLNAPARTPLWDRLNKEGRLREQNWVDQVSDTNIIPKHMTVDELRSRWIRLLNDTYSFENYGQRLKGTLGAIERKRQIASRRGLPPATQLVRGLGQLGRLLRYYLLGSRERRRFFLDILFYTLKNNPTYLREALWHVAIHKHFYTFSALLAEKEKNRRPPAEERAGAEREEPIVPSAVELNPA